MPMLLLLFLALPSLRSPVATPLAAVAYADVEAYLSGCGRLYRRVHSSEEADYWKRLRTDDACPWVSYRLELSLRKAEGLSWEPCDEADDTAGRCEQIESRFGPWVWFVSRLGK